MPFIDVHYRQRISIPMRVIPIRVAKWGNSLAIRIPAALAAALKLKSGDEVEIRIAGEREFELAPGMARKKALRQIRDLQITFPPDFKFDRHEANER
jgi:antitoxin MazE